MRTTGQCLHEPGVQTILRQLAEAITLGDDWNGAVLEVLEDAKTAPGAYVEPGMVSDVDRETCHVTGEVVQLWDSDHPKIAQAGLVAGPTDTITFSAWTKSKQNRVQEGDHVVTKDVQRNWYQGRVSIALTWDSHIEIRELAGAEE